MPACQRRTHHGPLIRSFLGRVSGRKTGPHLSWKHSVPMKIISWLTLPPLTLATLYLAVANRHRVLFSLDPFNADDPALALDVPLFVVVLFAMFLGILIGGASSWLRAGRGRSQARQTRREVKRLNEEVAEKPQNLPVVQNPMERPTE